MQDFGLNDEVIAKICTVLSKIVEVRTAVIYGSRARGDYKPYSDIDMMLTGDNINSIIQSKIETELDDLLLPYKIDICIHHHITNTQLLEDIEKYGKIFYERAITGM